MWLACFYDHVWVFLMVQQDFYLDSDEGDTSSSSSDAAGRREERNVVQPAPPPSPTFPEINRCMSEVIVEYKI